MSLRRSVVPVVPVVPGALLVPFVLLAMVACGSSDDGAAAAGANGTGNPGGASGANGANGANGSSGSGGVSGASGTGGGAGESGAGGAASVTTCTVPIVALDTTQATTTVGTGPGTCTEQAFEDAVAQGGVITFDCGGPATIPITSQKELRKDVDTVIDGAGQITLDGGGTSRILHFDGGDFRKTHTTVTLQHLTLSHGHSTGSTIPPAPPPCSQGFNLDGGGAAVLLNDGILHVIDVTFENGQAASPGPDVAGGGVYGTGSLDVTIVASRFHGNKASNGGAVGSLFSNLTLVDDVFEENEATGTGANTIDPACTVNGGESGDGGNGGAVVMDGGEDFSVVICGCTFENNVAGALGGAVFRTPDLGRQATRIDQCTFDGNKAKGGGALYVHHSDLTITASTFSSNSAEGAGAIQADDTQLDLTNDTFTDNSATQSLGGAISLFGNGGTIKNCTFADNHADAGSGLFGAAIAGGTTFTIDNSLFADNSSMDCGAPMTCQDGSSSGTSDLQWPSKHIVCDNDDPPCAAGGTTFADPKLGMLSDNGGPTRTRVPDPTGPAAGIGKGCPATDQRGTPRKNPDGCTAGAVEIE